MPLVMATAESSDVAAYPSELPILTRIRGKLSLLLRRKRPALISRTWIPRCVTLIPMDSRPAAPARSGQGYGSV
jgi:hypothetical protein